MTSIQKVCLKRFLIFSTILVFLTTGYAYDLENEFGFASQLIASNDYPEAITVLRRYVLFGENPGHKLQARFIIGSLYAKQQQHDRAAATFLEIMKDDETRSELREGAGFLAIQSMFFNKDPANYHVHLEDMESILGEISIEGKIQRRYMKGFLGVYAGSAELANLLPIDTNLEPVRSLSVSLRDQFQFWEHHPSKSPIASALLSTVIPGAGQFYNERYWDGAVALGMILGGSYWSHRLFDRGDDHWGWTVGVITGLLYLGQVRNAMIDTVRINERAELEFKQNLVSDYFMKFTLAIKDDDIQIGITF
jgi:TM2 domain-containing membrane protein YozV